MGLSFILVIGVFSVVFLIIIRKSIFGMIDKNNKLVLFFKSKSFFHNCWLTGFFLFFMNAVLFCLTILLLVGLQFLNIPFIHLVVMFLATVSSIFMWLVFHLSWQGERRGRFILGGVGSSFYLILTAWFFYKLVTIKPMFPGDDTFMASIGFTFGGIVTFVAFVTCFILTGFTTKAPRTV
jgi:hypothetical protein